jgi:hypothetical protein
MNEPVLKRVEYDNFTVDFVEKDGFTHLHVYGEINDVDKYIFDYFRRKIKDTGVEVETLLEKFKEEEGVGDIYADIRYMSQSDKDRFSAQRKKIDDKYKELLKLYEDRNYIHKTVTKKLFINQNMETKKKELYELPSQVITYKIPEINPFIDTLIIEMTSKIEKDLFNKTK